MRQPTTGRRRRWIAGPLLASLLAAAVLSGCGTDGYEPRGPVPPTPGGRPARGGPAHHPSPLPRHPLPAEPGSGDEEEASDPNVVATDLDVPTGLAVLPDGSAIVGERETGRIVQVFPDRAPPAS